VAVVVEHEVAAPPEEPLDELQAQVELGGVGQAEE
jgi:hypothetical protein